MRPGCEIGEKLLLEKFLGIHTQESVDSINSYRDGPDVTYCMVIFFYFMLLILSKSLQMRLCDKENRERDRVCVFMIISLFVQCHALDWVAVTNLKP